MRRKPLYLAVLLGIAFTTTGVVLRADDEAASVASAPAAHAAKTASTKSDHWSYQAVQKPAIPAVQNAQWVRTPIDAFILKGLEEKGIAPSADADRALLARRISLDVLGYIPSPEEVEEFVNDESPDAYEKLVDKLLASPHYGERQARRWLDLARYADSSGFENDTNRLNMWRYRDYVISAFNEDKPFDRFIQEQLAGDELWPGDETALIATGFMAHYPDNRNSRDMVQRHYQIVTDITDTVGEVILGQTFECARCHDHKFDAISQKEYYSLQSFFANVNSVNNIPVQHKSATDLAYEKATAEYDEATKDIRAKIDAIIDQDRDAALVYHKERYLTDTREAIFKPESEWTPLDRWINHRLATVTNTGALTNYFGERARSTDPNFFSEWHKEKTAELDALDEELKQFNNLKPALELGSDEISAMTELGHADSPPTFVLFGGDHERPLEEVQPGFPAAITDAQPEIHELPFSSGRRAALATWLTSAENPLTARVYVNRVWDQYFGRGIVETVSNFGKAGQEPTNPELLDYLASRFVEEGWSVKQLHREILLSSVYRQSSAEREDVQQADPENKLLGVFPHRRLEAEQIRDSLLVASGSLQDAVGGPSVSPPLPKTGQDGGYRGLWTESKNAEDHNRRSLYIFTRRSLPYPLLDVFNMASSQEAHSKREVTTTPLQALTLFNSELVYDWSRTLAGRVINEAEGGEQAQFDELYRILFARTPTETESGELEKFLDEQEKVITERASADALAASLPKNLEQGQLQPARVAAFVDLVHTVVNSNEFIHRF
ncbi:MAG: DUF1549 and DUF1553 domain-containing protein [Pseudomonadota bacterium]